ncbi:MAG: hypothetical protein KBF21_14235 [Thermoanaerobaculia bacterium]|nr:hypothetical protein [Thermoanaerobaculia bacterium]
MNVKTLDRRHPTYDAEQLQQLHALYEGGKAWHALKTHWLPGGGSEPGALCEERRDRAKYTNYDATIIDLITSQLFGEPPQVTVKGEGDAEPDAAAQEHAEDLSEIADGAALPFASLARAAFTDAQIYRRAWWMVELPATSQEAYADRLEQERAGALNAYLRPFAPPSVINWKASGTRPEWVVVREQQLEQVGPLDAPERVTRWTVVDTKAIRVFVVRQQERTGGGFDDLTDEQEAKEATNIAHGRTDADGKPLCPVVMMELPAGLHTGGKLLDPAAALCRAENELDWAVWRAANELLVIRDKLLDPKAPTLGHGYFLRLGDDNAEAYYAAPSGVALEVLSDRVKELRGELYRIVQQMALAADPSASKGRVSADSKREDWAASDRMLTSYADELRAFLTEAIRQALAVRTQQAVDSSTVQIEGLDGWQRDTTEAFLANLALAIEAKTLSPKFLEVAAKQQVRRVMGDTVTPAELEEIDDEIASAAAGLGAMTGMGAAVPGGADDTNGAGSGSGNDAGDTAGRGGSGGGGNPPGGGNTPTGPRRTPRRRGRAAGTVGGRPGQG